MFRFSYKFQTQANVAWLIVAVCAVSGLGGLTHFTSPENPLYIMIFFALFCISMFGTCYYLSNNIRRSLLFSGGVSVYLMLRMLGLRDVYYLILLSATIISLELYFQKR